MALLPPCCLMAARAYRSSASALPGSGLFAAKRLNRFSDKRGRHGFNSMPFLFQRSQPISRSTMTRPIYLQTAIVAFFATALLASSASAATVRNFSVLKSFGSNAFSEAFLSAPLTEGTDGYLYGTAQTGGAGGQGVIFRITKSGSEYSVLHAFTGSDGGAPRGGLIEPV